MMNGIEAILSQIRSDAERQAAELKADAQRQADALLAEGIELARAEAAEAASLGKARAAAILEKARQDAAIEARKRIAAEKQKLLDSAFDRALESLIQMPDDDYAMLLSALVVSACADGEGGELLFSAGDRARVGAAVLKRAKDRLPGAALTLSEDTAPIRGGVVVRRGQLELNCALEILVRMQAEQCSGEVARTLFPKGA